MILRNFGNLAYVKILHIIECEALEEFPIRTSNVLLLVELDFALCREFETILENFGNLTNVKI